jgi:hypothetical protein
VLLAVVGATAAERPTSSHGLGTELVLPGVPAIGIRIDTLLIGGYASGAFGEAIVQLQSDLSPEEGALVGMHLDRIFGQILPAAGLGDSGRLRIAYERAIRPDGTARSIRVLGAEVAVAGRVHTAYYFEHDERPGYFDPTGRSLDASGWASPLRSVRVSSPFGRERMHPILRRQLPHTGVDLAAPPGEPVLATADGIVAIAGIQGGYGLLVEVRHPDGYSTRYAHLSALTKGLAPSEVVRRGQILGYVGMTGLATGPHLHYEVRKRGQPVDPMALARGQSPASQATADPSWAQERSRVGRLLARAPVVTRVGRRAAGS